MMEGTMQQRNELIELALAARKNAYAKYSNYSVGAALLGVSGKIYTGVNVENASFPLCMCAERTAIFKAVSEGEREFQAIAIASENGGSPCGGCRQVLSEFGLDIQVITVDRDGNIHLDTHVEDLLPSAFKPSDLD
jgi:cytidine deaminase